MRTKALLCAAFVAAGAISAVAQQNVYSLNIVGYVNVTAPAGYSMLANPLSAGVTNGANEILPIVDQMTVLTFSGGAFQYYAVDGTSWIGADGGPTAPPSLPPGKGFFYFNPGATAQTITFVGQVVPSPNTTNSLALPVGYSLVGSPMPVGGTVSATPTTGNPPVPGALNLPIVDQTTILPFVNGAYQYYAVDGNVWIGADGSPLAAGPTINPGQGFFYFNPTAAPLNWLQTLQ